LRKHGAQQQRTLLAHLHGGRQPGTLMGNSPPPCCASKPCGVCIVARCSFCVGEEREHRVFLAQTSVVIVIWSEHLVKSHWVTGRASSQDKTGGMDCGGGSSLSGNHHREKEYQDYFCGETFIIAQFAMLLAVATYVGAADIAMESGVLSSRFRFIIALPLMATFFALSFRPTVNASRRADHVKC
jgi:hypothetical protein